MTEERRRELGMPGYRLGGQTRKQIDPEDPGWWTR